MLMVYGINTEDRQLSPKITSALASYTDHYGTKADPRRWTAYIDGKLYLSRYDGSMYELSGDDVVPIDLRDENSRLISPRLFEPRIIDNGSPVVFIDDDSGSVPVAPRFGRNGYLFQLLRDLNWSRDTRSGLTPKTQVQSLMIWMLALAFPDRFPTKPVLIIEGAPGAGKCLGKGTKVLKFDGKVINVEDVKVGDKLMGPDSTARTVRSVTSGTGPLYKVTPVKGDPWVCNDKHILTLIESHRNKIIDIPVEDFLKKSSYFRAEYKQFFVDVDFRSKKPLPIDPYFLGVWYGDGTKGLHDNGLLRSIQVTKPDTEIGTIVRDTAEKWGAQARLNKHRTGCAQWSICVNKRTGKRKPNRLLNTLRDVVGDVTEIPHAYLTASRYDRLQFLAGILDTDGYLGTNCFEIAQKRRGIADGICFIARSLGLRATMRAKYIKGYPDPYWRISISGDTRMIPTRIARKKATKRKQVKDVTRTGITVTPIGCGEFYGFELDKDGRFLLGDFTVTHNSMLLQMIQQSLFGHIEPMSISGEDNSRDFWVAMLRSPITILDNTDDHIKWLPDAVCSYTTRGYRTDRKLFTNDDRHEMRPHSFIAVASKDPKSFRREDLADRSVLMRLESRFEPGGRGGISANQITEWIDMHRAVFWGEWVYYLNRTVAALKTKLPTVTSTRMGDFEMFAHAACKALGWSPTIIPKLMENISQERVAFAIETDGVLEILLEWLAGADHENCPITLPKLFNSLNAIATAMNKPFVRTPFMLMQRLRAPHMRRVLRIQVETLPDDSIGSIGSHQVYTIGRWGPQN